MNYDVIPTICVAFVAVSAINAVAIYSIVKMLVTGRAVIERRDEHPNRIIHGDSRFHS
jgi:hypothetical protein